MQKQIVLTEEEYKEYEDSTKIFKDIFTFVKEPVFAYDGRGDKVAHFSKRYIQVRLDNLAKNLGWENMKFCFAKGGEDYYTKEYTTKELLKILCEYEDKIS